MSGIIINPYVYAATGLADIDNAYSMEFDGIDDSIITGLDCSSATHPSISVSCWLKTSYAGFAQQFPISVSAHQLKGTTYSLGLLNGGILQYATTTGSAVDDGNWHNVVWVFEHTGTPSTGDMAVNIYLDGNTTPDITATYTGSYGELLGNLYIGVYKNPSTGVLSNYFDGSVDEVAVWNSVLTPSDIENIYNATSPDKTADLSDLSTPPVAWYRMGD